MAGLLYKDFVGIKGRYQVIVFSVLTLAFLVFRVMFPGNSGVWGEFGLWWYDFCFNDRRNLHDVYIKVYVIYH